MYYKGKPEAVEIGQGDLENVNVVEEDMEIKRLREELLRKEKEKEKLVMKSEMLGVTNKVSKNNPMKKENIFGHRNNNLHTNGNFAKTTLGGVGSNKRNRGIDNLFQNKIRIHNSELVKDFMEAK